MGNVFSSKQQEELLISKIKMFPVSPDSQFVVPLDSLDLIFFNQYVDKSNDDKRLLWSMPDLDGESKYYEVNLVTENVDGLDSYIEPTETFMCHICNIDVPKPYFKQHTKSVMHKNYLKLTEKVLENVAKQIKIDAENIDAYDAFNEFYCETCCKVILVEHKQKHLKSAYHMKCKESEKQVDIFLQLYTNKHHVTSDIINSNTETDKINTTASDKGNIDLEYISNAESDFSEKINLNHETITKYSNNCNPNYNIVEIDAEINVQEKYAKYSLGFKINDYMYIETPNGYKEKVKMLNFHSYVEISDLLFCQVCDMWLDKSSQEHKDSQQHVKNISQPINDDFFRPMMNKKMNHCILCNIIVRTETNHATNNPNHKNCITKEHKTDKDRAPKKTFCDICDIYI